MNFTIKKSAVYSFFIFWLLMISGNPVFNYIGYELVYVITLIMLLAFPTKDKEYFFGSLNFFLFFLFLFLLQIIYFQQINFVSYLGFFVRALICLIIVSLVPNFICVAANVIYKISAFSLIVWVLSFTGVLNLFTDSIPPLHSNEWTGVSAYSFGFHTYYVSEYGEILRNAGLFWEPGAFAAYISVGLIFLILSKRSLQRHFYWKSSFVLYAAMLSTMSTMGYISLFIISAFQFFEYAWSSGYSRKKLFYAIFGFFSIIGSSILFLKTEFLSDKIFDHLYKSSYLTEHELGESNTRFGTFLFDMHYIKENPLIGNGLHESTRYRNHNLEFISDGHGNGLTDFIAKFGLLSFLFLIICWHRFVLEYTTSLFTVYALLLVYMTVLFSEPMLNYPFFWFFFFLQVQRSRL